ncbi:uncharacterized protein isoform X4 [Danio rerio]|uniref:Uncharacterized protein isoform X4 n=1 Tax=Danio rerio TaxID=7955 RepID=A0AC58JA56_DANRE
MSRVTKKKNPSLHQGEDNDEEEVQVVVEEAVGGKPAEVTEVSVAELASLLRAHMARTECREMDRQREYVDQERRFKALQHQFSLLQMEVQARTSPTTHLLDDDQEASGWSDANPLNADGLPVTQVRQNNSDQTVDNIVLPPSLVPRLEKLNETDDVEHFLVTFERIAVACRWNRSDWVWHLIPLLTGKARAAYVNMEVTESADYDKVKSAILKKYDINVETYRQRFRSLAVNPSESPKELYSRLKELFTKWIQPKGKTVEEVSEAIILEQYLRMLSPELQVWIRERDPGSASEAASWADVFVAARGRSKPWTFKSGGENRSISMGQGRQKTEGQGKPYFGKAPGNLSLTSRRPPICHMCGQEGHIKPNCPKNSVQSMHLCFVPKRNPIPADSTALRMTVVETDGKLLSALIDTGSDQTLMDRRFVPPALIDQRNQLPIRCVHGDERLLPTASISMKVKGQAYVLKVGVSDSLPFPIILGRDLPVLFELLHPAQECNMVVTRSMAKPNEEHVHTLSTLPFFETEIETGVAKRRKTRREKIREKVKHNAFKPSVSCHLPVNFQLPTNIIQMQQSDISLKECLSRSVDAEEEKPEDDKTVTFVRIKGILYRQIGPRRQLVVPQCVREVVLHLSHSVPWAGHLGKNKTIARIKRYFYWPGLEGDVAQFCKSCPVCQKVSLQRPRKAPLQPLPIITTPFERLGMDVVGPLEKSRSGNRFMLVITDYATRYPEVFPLRSVKAKSVATSLVQLFSRVGFPMEILTDQGTNFMSTLLKQVYRLLGIKSIRTTPYHPQTDGLTERFNQTLKQMLRKFVTETGQDWDQWLPYLLFAYREVPQSSTGFSPFELLYGRDVRGPLALLKEVWKDSPDQKEPNNVVSYVLQMRERFEKMASLAQTNLTKAKEQQRLWYDPAARERNLQVGQKVLVMLPNEESKLLAKWQGPFDVKRKLSPTTYEIFTPGQARASRVLHVNLLKEWTPRAKGELRSLMVCRVGEEESDEQYLPEPNVGDLELDHLSEAQQSQVRAVCTSDVFSEFPGFTKLIQHDIVLKPEAVVRRRSYRVPERLQEKLKEEVEMMLHLGIIEPSHKING